MCEHFIRCESICVYDEVGVFMSVCQPAELFFVVGWLPFQVTAGGGIFEGAFKKDEDIWVGDDLPHLLDVGMFLRDVTAAIAVLFQPRDQRGFARAARTNNSN